MAVYQKAFPDVAKPLAIWMSIFGFGGLFISIEMDNQLLALAQFPYWLIYLLMAFMGVVKVCERYDEKKVRSFFFKLPLWFIDFDELRLPSSYFEHVKRTITGNFTSREDVFLIGKGFAWRQKHVQMLYNVELDSKFKDEYEKAIEDIEGITAPHASGMDEETYITIPDERTVAHTGIEGTTRVGKTRVLEVLATQQIFRKDGCVIIIDPKGDKKLVDTVYNACCEDGTPERFKFFSPVFPEISETINPTLRYDEPSDVASRLVRMIQSKEGESDGFINFVLGELLTLVEIFDYLRKPMSMLELLRALTMDNVKADLANIVQLLAAKDKTPRGKRCVEGIKHIIDHPIEHYKKMIIVITPILEMLTTGNMSELLNSPAPSLEWHRSIKNKDVIVISLGGLINKARAEQLARIMLEDLISHLGRTYAYEDPKDFTKIYLHADEVGDYLSPAYVNMLNKGGGVGLRTFSYFQTEEDWATILGSVEAAERALGNLNNRIWLRTLSKMGIDNLLKSSPVTSVIMTQESVSRTPRPDDPDLLFQSSVSSRTTPQEVPMLDGRMLKSLPRGQGFMFTGGKYSKIRFPMLKDPERSFFADKGIDYDELQEFNNG